MRRAAGQDAWPPFRRRSGGKRRAGPEGGGPDPASFKTGSTAAHRIAAVQALVAGAVAHGDVAAGVAERSVARELAQELVLRRGSLPPGNLAAVRLLHRLGRYRGARRL